MPVRNCVCIVSFNDVEEIVLYMSTVLWVGIVLSLFCT